MIIKMILSAFVFPSDYYYIVTTSKYTSNAQSSCKTCSCLQKYENLFITVAQCFSRCCILYGLISLYFQISKSKSIGCIAVMRLIFCIYRNKKFRVKCAENYALKMIILFHGFLLNIVLF